MAKTNKDTSKADRIIADIIPRIICLLLALIIWIYVVFNDTPDYEKSFEGVSVTPINVAVLDDNSLTVYGDINATVEVVIYGARGDITTYSSNDIRATVDFIGITEAGEHTLPIKIELPDGATARSYSPKNVTVNVQEVTEKQVPIIANPKYETAYVIGEAMCLNQIGLPIDTVTVSGPASKLDLIDHVEARPSYDGLLTSSVTAVGVPLVTCTKDGEEIQSPYVSVTPATVKVEVPVYDEKEVAVKVDTDSAALKGDIKSITVKPATIKIRKKIVRNENLDDINEICVAIFNEENITGMESSEKIVLPVKLENGYENMSDFDSVTATVVYRENSDTISSLMSFDCTEFFLENPSGKAFKLVTESVNVKIRVPKMTAIALSGTYNAFDEFLLVGSIDNLKDGKVKMSLKVPDKYGDGIALVGEYYVEVSLVK